MTIQSILSLTNLVPTVLVVPAVSANIRLLWPGRLELVYRRYLADKESWIRAYPDVQPG